MRQLFKQFILCLVVLCFGTTLYADDSVDDYFTLVVFSDPHIGQDGHDGASVADMQKYSTNIVNMGTTGGKQFTFTKAPSGFVPKADIVICLGDMDGDSEKSGSDFKSAVSPLANASFPFLVVGGNHDFVPDYWSGGDIGLTSSGATANSTTLSLVTTYFNAAKSKGITDYTRINDGTSYNQTEPMVFKFGDVRFYLAQTYWFQKPWGSASLLSNVPVYSPDGVIDALQTYLDSHQDEPAIWMQHYPFVAGSDCDYWWTDVNSNRLVRSVSTAYGTYGTTDAEIASTAQIRKDKMLDLISQTDCSVHFSGHTHAYQTYTYTSTTDNTKKITDYTVAGTGATPGAAYIVLVKKGVGVVEVKQVSFRDDSAQDFDTNKPVRLKHIPSGKYVSTTTATVTGTSTAQALTLQDEGSVFYFSDYDSTNDRYTITTGKDKTGQYLAYSSVGGDTWYRAATLSSSTYFWRPYTASQTGRYYLYSTAASSYLTTKDNATATGSPLYVTVSSTSSADEYAIETVPPTTYNLIISPADLEGAGIVLSDDLGGGTKVNGDTFSSYGTPVQGVDYTINKVKGYNSTADVSGTTLTITYEKQDPYTINFPTDQTYTRNDRYLKQIKLGTQTIDVNWSTSPSGSIPCYQDLTTDETKKFTVYEGESVAPGFNWAGTWMKGVVYLDKDNDGNFEGDAVTPTAQNAVRIDNNSGSFSAFSVPAPGTYRMRYLVDWPADNTDEPGGRLADDGTPTGSNGIIANGGSITDVLLEVLEIPTITYTVSVTGSPNNQGGITLSQALGGATINNNGTFSFKSATAPLQGTDFTVLAVDGYDVSSVTIADAVISIVYAEHMSDPQNLAFFNFTTTASANQTYGKYSVSVVPTSGSLQTGTTTYTSFNSGGATLAELNSNVSTDQFTLSNAQSWIGAQKGAGKHLTITIEGLVAGNSYNVSFVTGLTKEQAGTWNTVTSTNTVGSAKPTLGSQSIPAAELIGYMLTDVVADANGEIVLSVNSSNGSHSAVINCLSIYGTPTPDAEEQTFTVHVTGAPAGQGGITLTADATEVKDNETFEFLGTPKSGTDFTVIDVDNYIGSAVVSGTNIIVTYEIDRYAKTVEDITEGWYQIEVGEGAGASDYHKAALGKVMQGQSETISGYYRMKLVDKASATNNSYIYVTKPTSSTITIRTIDGNWMYASGQISASAAQSINVSVPSGTTTSHFLLNGGGINVSGQNTCAWVWSNVYGVGSSSSTEAGTARWRFMKVDDLVANAFDVYAVEWVGATGTLSHTSLKIFNNNVVLQTKGTALSADGFSANTIVGYEDPVITINTENKHIVVTYTVSSETTFTVHTTPTDVGGAYLSTAPGTIYTNNQTFKYEGAPVVGTDIFAQEVDGYKSAISISETDVNVTYVQQEKRVVTLLNKQSAAGYLTDMMDGTLYGKTQANIANEAQKQWYLDGNGEDGYTLRNMMTGKYVISCDGITLNWSTGVTGSTLYKKAISGDYITFTKTVTDETDGTSQIYMHSSNGRSQQVCNWKWNGSDYSWWTMADVANCEDLYEVAIVGEPTTVTCTNATSAQTVNNGGLLAFASGVTPTTSDFTAPTGYAVSDVTVANGTITVTYVVPTITYTVKVTGVPAGSTGGITLVEGSTHLENGETFTFQGTLAETTNYTVDAISGYHYTVTITDGDDDTHKDFNLAYHKDLPDFTALNTAIAKAEQYENLIQDGLGYYHETFDSGTFATYLAQARAIDQTEDSEATQEEVDGATNRLNALLTYGIAINLPQPGTFLRMKGTGNLYLADGLSNSHYSTSSTADDHTLFYYTADSKLKAVGTGKYNTANYYTTDFTWADDEADGVTVTFKQGTGQIGKYAIETSTNSSPGKFAIQSYNQDRVYVVASNITTEYPNSWTLEAVTPEFEEITVSSATRGTYASENKLNFAVVLDAEGNETSNMSAYYCDGSQDNTNLLKMILVTGPDAESHVTNAGFGLYIASRVEGAATYKVLKTTSLESEIDGDNYLKSNISGAIERVEQVDEETGYKNFILQKKISGLRFYLINKTGNNIGNHRAYLSMPVADSTAKEFYNLPDIDDTTGIETAESQNFGIQEFLEGQAYNLNGQKVDEPMKGGIYIVNGKKVFMK